MDEFEYTLDNEQQFWDELDDIVVRKCSSHGLIDNALRSYLSFASKFKDEYLQSDYDVARCIQKLLRSEIFELNQDYVRIQLIYCFMQEEEPATLHFLAAFLLFDGGQNEATFEKMVQEGCFQRLIDLIRKGRTEDPRLHRLLLELLYESSRMQRLDAENLEHVDDEFVTCLFQIIEELSDDVDDPYHYPVIRVLLVLNEQYMVAATASPTDDQLPPPPLTNRVIKLLGIHGHSYKTFGENIILLLNRETETSLQLLILKLLYLLFTTRATHEYFYYNDLRVLLDVIIRNLLDLPDELIALRHTYLRVLYPLLAHSQLNEEPYYKRDEIKKVLHSLRKSGSAHWEPADETTIRLVDRVAKVPWIRDDDIQEGEVARKLLGMSLSPSQTGSSISVVDIAAVSEKPGVQTPSRNNETAHDTNTNTNTNTNGHHKEAPPPPPAHHSPETGKSEASPKTENSTSNPTRRGKRYPPPPIPVARLDKGKKLPPKTPPRRRTKLKTVSASELPAAESQVPVVNVMTEE